MALYVTQKVTFVKVLVTANEANQARGFFASAEFARLGPDIQFFSRESYQLSDRFLLYAKHAFFFYIKDLAR